MTKEHTMSRIQALDPTTTEGKTSELLAAVNKMLGVVPNLFRVTANSQPSLDAMVALFGATARGKLGARTREAIALVVAETNGCDYCLSAHSVLGAKAGLAKEDVDAARDASSKDAKTAAILRLARTMVLERGAVGAAGIASLREAGVSDAEALEVVTNVVLNIFTNYVNLLADTEIDFPVVRAASR
jgi:uncharacterized peroxidase-related enzyme